MLSTFTLAVRHFIGQASPDGAPDQAKSQNGYRHQYQDMARILVWITLALAVWLFIPWFQAFLTTIRKRKLLNHSYQGRGEAVFSSLSIVSGQEAGCIRIVGNTNPRCHPGMQQRPTGLLASEMGRFPLAPMLQIVLKRRNR